MSGSPSFYWPNGRDTSNSLFTYAHIRVDDDGLYPGSADPLSLTTEPKEIYFELDNTFARNQFPTSQNPVSPYVLWAGGCRGSGSSQDSCSTFCLDQTSVWSSTNSLSNCVAASYIAANLSGQVDADTIQQAHDVGVYASNDLIGYVKGNVTQCIRSYCDSETCGEACLDFNLTDGASFSSCYKSLCSYLSLGIDSDIGGVGVSHTHNIVLLG